jgi:hypothetical protein
MGYNCNSPKEVVYGPSELFGYGMHNYYIEQGIRQLTALVGHIRQDSETGRLIRIELQWCQVQAGTGTHLLGDPKDPIDYIETCWVMLIRDFLRTYGLRIEFTRTPIQAIQCENDEFLMDALRVRGCCTATELQRLNACRMWLQVSRVSDISSAEGRFLRKECLVGTNTTTYQSSTRWPRQGRPPKTWWALWKKKIQVVLSSNGVSPTLRVPLGRWHAEVQTGKWDVVFSAMLGQPEIFCLQQNGEYDVFRGTEGAYKKHTLVSTVRCGRVDRCPVDAVPAMLGPRQKDGKQRAICRHRAVSNLPLHSFVQSQEEYI